MTELGLAALQAAAEAAGFTYAGPLDAATLEFLPQVRDMCAADKCRQYGRSWACPPACAPLETLRQRAAGYRRGLLVQTVAALEDSFDFEGMMEGQRLHSRLFQDFSAQVLSAYPDAFPMGAGTCMRCEVCTYPNAPCRFPALVFPSMEACGLVVSDVCQKNGMGYHHGPNTVTYTSCYLTD